MVATSSYPLDGAAHPTANEISQNFPFSDERNPEVFQIDEFFFQVHKMQIQRKMLLFLLFHLIPVFSGGGVMKFIFIKQTKSIFTHFTLVILYHTLNMYLYSTS